MIGKGLVTEFVSLTKERRECEERIKQIAMQLEQLEKKLLTQMTDMGVQRLTVERSTVYINRQIWASKASGVTDEDAAVVLQEVGLGDMVKPKFNTQTMSAYVREMDGQGRELPEPLKGVLSIVEKFSVRVIGVV